MKPTGVRLWTGRTLLWLVTAFMTMDAAMHLARPAFAVEATRKAGVNPVILLPIGCLELLFLALLVSPRFRVLGAVFFTAFFGGATAVHVLGHGAFFAPVVFALLLWAGVLCLRPDLQPLLGLTVLTAPRVYYLTKGGSISEKSVQSRP